MSVRFRIEGRLDTSKGGTVVIDRERKLFAVRPLHSRRTYALPLHTVAEMVISRVVKFELRLKK